MFTHPIDVDDGHGWAHQTGDRVPDPPIAGQVFRRPLTRRWDVQPRTGFASSTVPQGRWHRGVLFRAPQVPVLLPPYQYMIDPTHNPEAADQRIRAGRGRAHA